MLSVGIVCFMVAFIAVCSKTVKPPPINREGILWTLVIQDMASHYILNWNPNCAIPIKLCVIKLINDTMLQRLTCFTKVFTGDRMSYPVTYHNKNHKANSHMEMTGHRWEAQPEESMRGQRAWGVRCYKALNRDIFCSSNCQLCTLFVIL